MLMRISPLLLVLAGADEGLMRSDNDRQLKEDDADRQLKEDDADGLLEDDTDRLLEDNVEQCVLLEVDNDEEDSAGDNDSNNDSDGDVEEDSEGEQPQCFVPEAVEFLLNVDLSDGTMLDDERQLKKIQRKKKIVRRKQKLQKRQKDLERQKRKAIKSGNDKRVKKIQKKITKTNKQLKKTKKQLRRFNDKLNRWEYKDARGIWVLEKLPPVGHSHWKWQLCYPKKKYDWDRHDHVYKQCRKCNTMVNKKLHHGKIPTGERFAKACHKCICGFYPFGEERYESFAATIYR